MRSSALMWSLLLVSVASLGWSQAGAPDPYWVSPSGQASWAAARSPTPLNGAAACSLDTANRNAQAGDLIYLRGGRYTGDVYICPSNSGVRGSPITYRAYERETVTLTTQRVPNRFHETNAWTSVQGAIVQHSQEQVWQGSYSTKFTVTAQGQGARSDLFRVVRDGYCFSAWVYSDRPTVNVLVQRGDGAGAAITKDFPIPIAGRQLVRVWRARPDHHLDPVQHHPQQRFP